MSCYCAFVSSFNPVCLFPFPLLSPPITAFILLLFNPRHRSSTVTPLLSLSFSFSFLFFFSFFSSSLCAPALARASLPTRQATWTIPGGKTWLWVQGTWAPRDPLLHTMYLLSGPFPSRPPLVQRNRPLLPASRRGTGACRKGQLIKRTEAVSNA